MAGNMAHDDRRHDDLRDAAYVLSGRVRLGILGELGRPMTPTALADRLRTHRSTVSRALSALEEKGLVKCVTPERKLVRFYRITSKGQVALDRARGLGTEETGQAHGKA